MTDMLVYCDRCQRRVEEAFRTPTMTAGFYDVSGGSWAEYARGTECNVCDSCMWKDPKYVERYGHQPVRKAMTLPMPEVKQSPAPSNPKLFEWVAGPPGQHPQHFDTEITLRDLFAAFALAGEIAADPSGSSPYRDKVDGAWIAADMMLAAREVK